MTLIHIINSPLVRKVTSESNFCYKGMVYHLLLLYILLFYWLGISMSWNRSLHLLTGTRDGVGGAGVSHCFLFSFFLYFSPVHPWEWQSDSDLSSSVSRVHRLLGQKYCFCNTAFPLPGSHH